MQSGNFDCPSCISKFMKYEEDVVNGLIVQVFYYIGDIEDISQKDRFLFDKSFKYGGARTGQCGLYDAIRRDIDFYFSAHENAAAFKKEVEKEGFQFHHKYNRNGELLDYPSLTEITTVRNKLVELNC